MDKTSLEVGKKYILITQMPNFDKPKTYTGYIRKLMENDLEIYTYKKETFILPYSIILTAKKIREAYP